ncbi:MAG: EamA family transporter [Steroidobacteraceae bacterium]
MTPTNFLLIITGVLLNAAAQLLLKAGTNSLGTISFSALSSIRSFMHVAFQPFIVAGLMCYVFSVAIWIAALSRTDVSVAYPMLSIGYVVNAIFAWWLLGESLGATRIAGIFVILVGVTLLYKS